jgi:hypothetical protein
VPVLSVLAIALFTAVPATAESQTLRGTVAPAGAVCPQVRLSSGETISVEGLPRELREVGRRIEMQGTFLRDSRCQQGRAFRMVEGKYL